MMKKPLLFFAKIIEAIDTYIIVLTPDDKEDIIQKLQISNLPIEKFRVLSAPHAEVPSYLSAAHYGFALVKPSPSKLFVSLVKIGEYWATGLPVIITHGIGDESTLIEKHHIGFVLPPDWQQLPIEFFREELNKIRANSNRQFIRSLAEEYRNYDVSYKAYEHFGLI